MVRATMHGHQFHWLHVGVSQPWSMLASPCVATCTMHMQLQGMDQHLCHLQSANRMPDLPFPPPCRSRFRRSWCPTTGCSCTQPLQQQHQEQLLGLGARCGRGTSQDVQSTGAQHFMTTSFCCVVMQLHMRIARP